jgi:hypothetical protein
MRPNKIIVISGPLKMCTYVTDLLQGWLILLGILASWRTFRLLRLGFFAQIIMTKDYVLQYIIYPFPSPPPQNSHRTSCCLANSTVEYDVLPFCEMNLLCICMAGSDVENYVITGKSLVRKFYGFASQGIT